MVTGRGGASLDRTEALRLNLPSRATLDLGLELKDAVTFYYTVLALLVMALVLLQRLVHPRSGRVVQGIRDNETRMQAIGYPTFQYKLICFVIAGRLASRDFCQESYGIHCAMHDGQRSSTQNGRNQK